MYDWPIYECLVIACLVISLPGVLSQLSTKSLYENPITACVVGLWFAVVFSHLATWEAWTSGVMFAKVVIYYLLLVANVNSEARIKTFLRWLLVLIALLAAIALLTAHHIIQLPDVRVLLESQYDRTTGRMVVITRLQATGIFHDPNDLAMILVTGAAVAICFAANPALGMRRILLLPLVGLFGYAIYRTQSRGGLLALMAALASLLHARWGWKRTALAAAVALPLLLAASKGRMMSYADAMDSKEGTAQARLQLWSDGLQLLKQQPVFGIGEGNYGKNAGQVAHNSFLHAFTELGFFGGPLFLGAFLAGFMMLYRLRGEEALAENSELARLLPYVTAMLVGFAVSMFSLSQNYTVPTYMMLGLVTAYIQVAGGWTQVFPLRFDAWFLKRLAFGSACFLAAMYVFVRVAVRWS